MKIKNNITEKKLTKSELEVREKVIKDLKKNKSSLVKRYGKDAEAVMYGRATNIAKKMAESENKNRIKELVKKSLMKEDEVTQDKDHKITQEGNLWVLVYKNKNKTFKHHFSSKKEAEEFWNNNKNSDNSMKFEEGKKEDVTGDGKIDSKDYLAKRDIAIQKAKSKMNEADMDLDHKVKYSKSNDTYQVWLGDEIVTDFATKERAEKEAKRLNHLQDIKRLDKAQMKEDIDLGHEDNEPHMIKGDLYRIGKYAMELYAMAEKLEETGQEIDFPSWWQAMITDASTKMVKAKHYLDFELKEPAIDAVVGKLTGKKPPMMESAYDYVKTPKEYITLQLSDFFRVPKTNLMSFNLDGTDDIEALTQALNSTSTQGTEKYLKSSIKSAQDHFNVTEGFLDRMKASVKGAVAGVGQAAKNIGSAVKGDSSQFKSVSNTANMAKLGQKVKTFGKEIDDVINDINKLFPKEKLDKDPELKGKIEKYLATLNQTKTLNTAISSVDENMFTGRNNMNRGSSYSDYSSDSDISIDILASKIAKALKNPENQDEDDQNNIKQARKALNLGDIEIAGKIIKPYITEKRAKQLKEYTVNDFRYITPGSGRPKIDPALFAKLMPKSAKTCKEAEARIKMYNGYTMFVHSQYFVVTPNGNMPNKPKYEIHQSQYYNNDYNAPANLKGQDVNVTFLTIFDVTNGEVELGVCYVDTKVFLDEYKVVFELLKSVSEDIRQNSPGELDGEYEGKPQKIQGADIYDTLKDILDISNSENDFIRKITDSLTDETSSLSKSTEKKLRNWYKKNVTN
jgi:hypothetical protein